MTPKCPGSAFKEPASMAREKNLLIKCLNLVPMKAGLKAQILGQGDVFGGDCRKQE